MSENLYDILGISKDDLDAVRHEDVYFGISNGIESQDKYFLPIKPDVKSLLISSIEDTIDKFNSLINKRENGLSIRKFEPSEDHRDLEPIIISNDNSTISSHSHILEGINKFIGTVGPVFTKAEQFSEAIKTCSFYFVVIEVNKKKLIAFKKSRTIKASIGKKTKLLINSGMLSIVKEEQFYIDEYFSFIYFEGAFYICQPKAFRDIAELKIYVKKQAALDCQKFSKEAPFISFENISKSVVEKYREACLMCSIVRRNGVGKINKDRLESYLNKQGVKFDIGLDGVIVIHDVHIKKFLEVLDRRAYTIDLYGDDENYIASRRSRAN